MFHLPDGYEQCDSFSDDVLIYKLFYKDHNDGRTTLYKIHGFYNDEHVAYIDFATIKSVNLLPISYISVSENHQKKGYGKRILHAFVRVFKEKFNDYKIHNDSFLSEHAEKLFLSLFEDGLLKPEQAYLEGIMRKYNKEDKYILKSFDDHKYFLHKKLHDDKNVQIEVDKEMYKKSNRLDVNNRDIFFSYGAKILNKYMTEIEDNVFNADENILYHSTTLKNGSAILLDGMLKIRDDFMHRGRNDAYSLKKQDDGRLFLSDEIGYFLGMVADVDDTNYEGSTVTFCIDISEFKKYLRKCIEYIDGNMRMKRLEYPYSVKDEDAIRYIEEYLNSYVTNKESEIILMHNVDIEKYVKRIYYNHNFDAYLVAEIKDSNIWRYHSLKPVIEPILNEGRFTEECLKLERK